MAGGQGTRGGVQPTWQQGAVWRSGAAAGSQGAWRALACGRAGRPWGVKARVSASTSAQQGLAPDCLQPPLVPRSGFRQQVKPSVAMTSNVKSEEQLFLGLHAVC